MQAKAAHVQPATDRRALSAVAYGFIGSKALFAALELDLFTHLAEGGRRVDELAQRTGVAENRMRTLLHALAALGLVVREDGAYANAPASARYLVRGGADELGEYFRLQIGRQIYPALVHLDAGMAGTGGAFDTLAGLMADADEARTFTDAQHAGSLAAARVLAARLDLGGARSLLDVGGGSGTFSIALCEANPGLRATVLDLPAVLAVAEGKRAAAGPADRISLLPGDATATEWPGGQDVVLMSYLLSALDEEQIDVVLAKAAACLDAGGLLVVHDFVLDDDEDGPQFAALWFLQYLAYNPRGISFSAADLFPRLGSHGFSDPSVEVLIPEITKVIVSRKAGS
jgi:2-hydroxy-4-(methylsulfanyl)butanoate S-methyltransferase